MDDTGKDQDTEALGVDGEELKQKLSAEDLARRACFSRNLVRFRQEADLSQAALATVAQIGVATISRAENSHTLPRTDHVARIAQALGRPVSDFFLESPPPMPESRRGPVRFRFVGPVDADLAARAIAEIERVNIEHHRRVQAYKARSRQGKKL